MGKADVTLLGEVQIPPLTHVCKQIVKFSPKKETLVQCTNCLKYGHRSCSHDPRCVKCGEKNHTQDVECHTLKCQNCGKAHAANSAECRFRKREEEILNKMNTQGT